VKRIKGCSVLTEEHFHRVDGCGSTDD